MTDREFLEKRRKELRGKLNELQIWYREAMDSYGSKKDLYSEELHLIEVQLKIKESKPVNRKSSSEFISRLADQVIKGEHGDGDDRKRSLALYYDEVQSEVNRRYRKGGQLWLNGYGALLSFVYSTLY